MESDMPKTVKREPWQRTLLEALRAHNTTLSPTDKTRRPGKRVSRKTQYERKRILFAAFRELADLGYRLENVRNFKRKHLDALVEAWLKRGLAASTLQNNLSTLRAFCAWIDKPGMVPKVERLVSDPDLQQRFERKLAAETDKTWSGADVDIMAKVGQIREEDGRVATQLELQLAFGLRMKESCLLRPHLADKGHYLEVAWGTKNGRPRVIPVDNDYQRTVLDKAKDLVRDRQGSTIPRRYSFEQWRQHFYYVIRKHGITRAALGVTPHGLRHERLNQIYEDVAGVPSPVKGGTPVLDKARDERARLEVARIAGHNRPTVASCYTGVFYQIATSRPDSVSTAPASIADAGTAAE